VNVQDLAGNQLQTEGPVFTVDATAPESPVILVAYYGQAGSLMPLFAFSPAAIVDPNPLLVIRAEFDTLVEVFDAEGGFLGIAQAQDQGPGLVVHTFAFAESLDPGTYLFEVFSSDLAGNRSVSPAPFQLAIL